VGCVVRVTGFSSYFSAFALSPPVQLLHGQQCCGGSLIYPAGDRRKNQLKSFLFGDSDVSQQTAVVSPVAWWDRSSGERNIASSGGEGRL